MDPNARIPTSQGESGAAAERGGRENSDTAVQSVTEFTRRVKQLLERGLRPCWVRGEVSNLRAQSSGHLYFSLKDAGAQLSAVLFRGNALRQSVRLRDGLQVVVFGEVSVYEPRGAYQLIVREVIEDGVGRLQREFEALKRRLSEEGLFASERKRPLPLMPATVGFITSPTGAAVRDFIRILERRGWRGRLVVLPAKVQGEGAGAEMVEMLRTACGLGLFDLLVIGRGGGSLEDLWAFNEEPLVRAVAASTVPIISAVGHEIDFTLCDFAADVRAETPSGAAELISSRFLEGVQRAARAAEAIEETVMRALSDGRKLTLQAGGRLRLLTPSAQIERGALRIDDLSNRLAAACRHQLLDKRRVLTAQRTLLERRSPEVRVQLASHQLLALWKRLQAASPQSVLNRGFVMMLDAEGKPLPRRGGIAPGQRLSARFADGDLPVRSENDATGQPR